MTIITRVIAIDHQLITGLLTIHTGCEDTAVNRVSLYSEQEVVTGPGTHLQHTGVIHITCDSPTPESIPAVAMLTSVLASVTGDVPSPERAALLNIRFPRPGGVITDSNGSGSQLGHVAATINVVIKLPVGMTVQHQ